MIFLDMDGVVADFDVAMCQWFGKPVLHAHEYSEHLSHHLGFKTNEEFSRAIWDIPAAFWQSIPVSAWANELIDLCTATVGENNLYFATAAVGSSHCAAGKMQWIEQHFPKMAKRTLLIRDKWLLAAPGRVLIDDTEVQCHQFTKHGGSSILFPQSWNQSKRHVPWRMKHVEFLLQGA